MRSLEQIGEKALICFSRRSIVSLLDLISTPIISAGRMAAISIERDE